MSKLRVSKPLYILIVSPLLILLITYDILKFPFIILFFAPFWGVLEFLFWLKGEEFELWDKLKDIGTMGFQLCQEILND